MPSHKPNTAQKPHIAQRKFLQPAQYLLLCATVASVIQNEKSGAAAYGLLSLCLETGFQFACNLIKGPTKSASLNSQMTTSTYSWPSKVGLSLFKGLVTTYETVTTAVQSGITNIEKELNSNGPK